MRSMRIAAASAASLALLAAWPDRRRRPGQSRSAFSCVDQLNAIYGAHPGVRANHATGALFEGTFTPAPGAGRSVPPSFSKARPRR